MPYIEEDTLLDLYKEIDVSNKDKEQYRKSYFDNKASTKKIRNFYAWGMGGLSLLLVGALGWILFTSIGAKENTPNPVNQNTLILALQDSLAISRDAIAITNEASLMGSGLNSDEQVVYKVQLASYKKPLRVKPLPWQIGDNGYIRLAVGEFASYREATALKNELKRIGFSSDIFLIAIYQGKKINLKQAVRMSKESYLLNGTN